MQVKSRKKGELGALAKGPTSEEFEDVMHIINEKAIQVVQRHPRVFGKGGSREPLFSFDDPPIHQTADLSRAGIKRSQRVPLPARSPDMHKVIEHCFGIVSRAMNKSLLRNSSIRSIEDYKAELQRLFFTCITQEGIAKDVDSLVHTYQSIASKDIEGSWPPKELR